MKAISLFSSSGIGDLGLRENGIKTIINSELLKARADLFSENFPESKSFIGDINENKDDIVNYYNKKYQNEELFLILATPPCQGMSQNGAGKLLSEYRKGNRPKLDERNQLIIPALDIIKKLKPRWVIFENVPQMANTVIEDNNEKLINILDYIKKEIGEEYVGKSEVVNSADYGIPQVRKRLITIYTRDPEAIKTFEDTQTFLPSKTHSNEDNNLKPWVTIRNAISDLPPIDGRPGKNKDSTFNEYHFVNPLDDKKYKWISHTPEGETAFNNQCINPDCLYQKNTRHGSNTVKNNGINQSNKDTPLYCEKCGSLLPRPYVANKKTNELRLMRGYTSAYKRMSWDMPASTITMNFQYVSSDNKIHPSQNRTLSIYEAMVLQSISLYNYNFKVNEKRVDISLIRDSIGESVPPFLIDLICKNLIQYTTKSNKNYVLQKQLELDL